MWIRLFRIDPEEHMRRNSSEMEDYDMREEEDNSKTK